MTQEYDDRAYELTITRCDDGDILLSQAECCGCGDETIIRLHRCHFPLLADHLGLLTREQFDQATERLADRLRVLAALIEGHTRPCDPLRVAADALLGTVRRAAAIAPDQPSERRQEPAEGCIDPPDFSLSGE